LPMTKHFGKSFSILFHFEQFKMLQGAFSSSTNHLWNAKLRTSHKRATKKKCILNCKMHFFSFWLLLLSNLITFLCLIHFKQVKMLQEHHLKLYKSSLNSNSNRATYNNFFECLGTSLCNVWLFVLLNFSPPLLWGAVTFTILFSFWRSLVH
jgi:hypothetical protein